MFILLSTNSPHNLQFPSPHGIVHGSITKSAFDSVEGPGSESLMLLYLRNQI